MEGCSLEDAYGDSFPAKRAGKSARREEREKAKKCKGPALTFLEKGEEDSKDPDRQSLIKPTDPGAMKGSKERFADMLNSSFISQADKKETGQEKRSNTQPVVPSANAIPLPSGLPAYFGADPLAEGFAPYTTPYTMHVDFKDSFPKAGSVETAGSAGKNMGVPGLNDVWGPLADRVNPILTGGYKDNGIHDDKLHKENRENDFSKKLDTIFARLDDLESARNGTENSQSEILLFVMTGVFILFTLDLLSKASAR